MCNHVTAGVSQWSASLILTTLNVRYSAINWNFALGPGEMGEHNLLNSGFVGPLVNIHTGDAFYLHNFRSSTTLPSLPYARRDNVWTQPEPCNGYMQPFFGNPVSLNSTFNRACELARQEDSKCFYSGSGAGNGSGIRENCAKPKRDDSVREDSSVSGVPQHGLHDAGLMGYGYAEHINQNPSSCLSMQSESGAPLHEGAKAACNVTQSLSSHACSTTQGGGKELQQPLSTQGKTGENRVLTLYSKSYHSVSCVTTTGQF